MTLPLEKPWKTCKLTIECIILVKKISNTINAEHEESNILIIQDKNRTKILDSSLKKERNNKKVLSKYFPYYD